MAVLYTAAAIFALLFLVFFAFPLELEIHARDKKTDIKLTAFFGLIKLPVKALLNKPKKKKPKKEDVQEPQKEDKIIGSLNKGLLLLKRIYKTLSASRHFARKRIAAKKIKADITFAMGDAALTGITTGLVWSVLYQLLGVFSLVATIDKHEFNVEPVYEEKIYFKREISCILKFSVVNIIGIGLVALYHYRKSNQGKDE